MRAAAALLALFAAAPAAAHDAHIHGVEPQVAAVAPAHAAPSPLPVTLGGPFALIDQDGRPRTEAEPGGRLQLLFFGYATCQAICNVALPRMAEIVERAAARGVEAVPVLITVDPAQDRPAAMKAALGKLHPGFVGLTGTDEALAAARRKFGVEAKRLFEGPEGPVFAHGSFIYLLDGAGKALTLIPPVVDPATGAEIVLRHAAAG